VANVCTTGNFIIPLMKKSGYRGTFAAAVEAVASTGGQIVPLRLLAASGAAGLLHPQLISDIYGLAVLFIIYIVQNIKAHNMKKCGKL